VLGLLLDLARTAGSGSSTRSKADRFGRAFVISIAVLYVLVMLGYLVVGGLPAGGGPTG
jgi:hypothetical protein